MEWDRMREQWQSRPAPDVGGSMDRPREIARLWHRIRRRDMLETAVGAVMAVFFAGMVWPLWLGDLQMAAVFALWLALACVYIPLRLARARALHPGRDSDLPVKAFLRAERLALARQRHLLSTVRWWYIAPITVGVLGLFISIRGLHWHSLAYVALVFLIDFGIERANRAAVRLTIDPAIRTLDEQIRQLEENDEK